MDGCHDPSWAATDNNDASVEVNIESLLVVNHFSSCITLLSLGVNVCSELSLSLSLSVYEYSRCVSQEMESMYKKKMNGEELREWRVMS